jgi:methylenetetrahydrofolate dehydrogenase (NAD+)
MQQTGFLPVSDDQPPPGTVKSILPCTPLAVVKCLENLGVYNRILTYGDRAYGKTVTVINRWAFQCRTVLLGNVIDEYDFDRSSEVVGRPLAALLANDGARVFSVDIDSIQEYTKRPHVPPPEPTAEPSSSGEPSSSEVAAAVKARRYHPRHVVHPTKFTLQQCLALSDVVVSAVPSPTYKVKTEWLKDGCLCVNVAADKNFEKDVREKVSCPIIHIIYHVLCFK